MLSFILFQVQSAAPAAAEEAVAQQGAGGWSFWVMLIMLFLVFYLFMIRPQQKKQKELQKQREGMKKGDKVITAGGLYGIIKDVQENAFIIEIAKDVTIKVDKASVYQSAEDVEEAPAKEQPTKNGK